MKEKKRIPTARARPALKSQKKKPAETKKPSKNGKPIKSQATSVPLIQASAVTERETRWLVPGRIPIGGLTFLEGLPSCGKTSVAIDLIARATSRAPSVITPGLMFNGHSAKVVYMTTENSQDGTILRRLRAAGADLTRVQFVPLADQRRADLKLPALANTVKNWFLLAGVRMLVLDPWISFLANDININYESQARQALEPLIAAAEQYSLVVLLLRHWTKDRGALAVHRGGGNGALSAMARSVLACVQHERDNGLYLWQSVKVNDAAPAPAIAYRLRASGGAVVVKWEGEFDVDVDDPVARAEAVSRTSQFRECQDLIRLALSSGPVKAKKILDEAQTCGHKPTTVHAAKVSLGVESVRSKEEDGTVSWEWIPPKEWPADERRKL